MRRFFLRALARIKTVESLRKGYIEALLPALLILAGVSVIAVVRNSEISVIKQIAEDRNVNTTKILSVIFRENIEALSAIAAAADSPSRLRRAPETAELLEKMTLILQGSNIAKVKIYNTDGLTLFSSQTGQIGEDKSVNPGFRSARAGRTASELVQRDHFSAFEGERVNVDLLSSYIPVVADGQVVAVFEQYQDVTALIGIIDRSLWKQAATATAIFICVYAVLLTVIRRSRAMVDLHVARLHAANRRLDDRVAERTAELRRSEERLRRLTAMSSDFYWESGVTHCFTMYKSTPGGMGETSHSADSFIDVLQWEPPKTPAEKALWEAWRRLLNARRPFRGFEISGKAADGRELHLAVSGDPVLTEDGAFLGYHGVGADITERKHNEDLIRELAYFDQLTGLPNRTLLHDRLEIALADAARNEQFCALLHVDLDKFKLLNDTRGHVIGDRLLKETACRLATVIRDGDTAAHLGGDEFIIILKGVKATTRDSAVAEISPVAERLLEELRRPCHLGDGPYQATACIGLTLSDGRSESIADLFRQMDIALHKSRERGGDTFSFFDAEMERILIETARLEADIDAGIKQQQFELYFQPQVDPESGAVHAAEALLRWNHPTRGLVPPNDFIPHAERSGQIIPLGRWVLENACRHLAQWAADPVLARLVVSVNVSTIQFRDEGFVAEVRDTLNRTGADPNRLKIELTESVFADHAQRVAATMAQLRALGVTFALDDFGTGYSSLSYLSALPIDQLKIDRSFVKGIEAGDRNLAICLATIRIARSLQLKVVAEGVENETEAYVLGAVHHCDLLQGYLFGRPMPRQAFEQACADAAHPPEPRKRRKNGSGTA
jgi:diguanylate cyclase (GGDEF)-like protein